MFVKNNFSDLVLSGYAPARFENGQGVVFETGKCFGNSVICVQGKYQFYRTKEEIANLFYICDDKGMNPFVVIHQ